MSEPAPSPGPAAPDDTNERERCAETEMTRLENLMLDEKDAERMRVLKDLWNHKKSIWDRVQQERKAKRCKLTDDPQEPTWVMEDVTAPDLPKLEVGSFVNVDRLADLLVAPVQRPVHIYMRKHLVDVCNACIEELEGNTHPLVSLVGCPGTGKTWCGWVVARHLHAKGIRTLHVSFKMMWVSAVINFEQKRTLYNVHARPAISILNDLTKEAGCDVCILDVSDLVDAVQLFNGMRTLVQFHSLKVLAILSGHGENLIVGPGGAGDFLMKVRRMVFWSWSEEDVKNLLKLKAEAGVAIPEEAGYEVCGGSVRMLCNPVEDEEQVRQNVMALSNDQLKRLLNGERPPTTDQNEKQFSNLLAFFGKADSPTVGSFADTDIVPRSRYVILRLRQNVHVSMGDVVTLYRTLKPMNPGAAGTAFELLVHKFWDGAIAEKSDVTLVLTSKSLEVPEKVVVHCAELGNFVLEDYEDGKKELEPGYFVPKNPRYPVIDSVLLYRCGESILTLAIQVSIGQQHEHGELENHLVGKNGVARKLALWDFPAGGKRCTWKPLTSDHWALVHVSCPEFDMALQRLGMFE